MSQSKNFNYNFITTYWEKSLWLLLSTVKVLWGWFLEKAPMKPLHSNIEDDRHYTSLNYPSTHLEPFTVNGQAVIIHCLGLQTVVATKNGGCIWNFCHVRKILVYKILCPLFCSNNQHIILYYWMVSGVTLIYFSIVFCLDPLKLVFLVHVIVPLGWQCHIRVHWISSYCLHVTLQCTLHYVQLKTCTWQTFCSQLWVFILWIEGKDYQAIIPESRVKNSQMKWKFCGI